MNDTLSIGQKIRFFRIKKGLTIEEFADKVKVSRQMISKWEHGDSVPRLDTAIQIVKELNINLDDLRPGEVGLEDLSAQEYTAFSKQQ